MQSLLATFSLFALTLAFSSNHLCTYVQPKRAATMAVDSNSCFITEKFTRLGKSFHRQNFILVLQALNGCVTLASGH